MPYVIEFDGLRFPVHDFDVNRVPPFTFFWGVFTKDLVGVIHDPVKDYFQITFSTYNMEPLVRKVLSNFCSGKQCSVTTPYASFSDAVVHMASISDDSIEVSLLANSPGPGVKNLSHDLCVSLEVNYRNALPGFVNLFQFGNYLALSTYPFKLSRKIPNGSLFFENDVWSVYRMPVTRKPNIYKFYIDRLEGYCFINLPELMSHVVIQPGQGNTYTYAFGVNPTCELSAYIQIEDLVTGDVWYQTGNQGNITLAQGTYKLTPLVTIPEFNPIPIYGEPVTLMVPDSQHILMFLTPLTLSLEEPLCIYAFEDLILHFRGWKTVKAPKDTVTEVKFDYPGVFQCDVYSTDRNLHVTSFTVSVYGISIPESKIDCIIRVRNDLITKRSTVWSNAASYIAINDYGKILGYNKGVDIIVDDRLLTSQSQVIVLNEDYYTIRTDSGRLIDSHVPDKFVRSVDVILHSIPVVGKPVYISIDGLIKGVEFEDADVEQISNTLYKVVFKSEGTKKITLYLPKNKMLVKYIVVEPGFRKIVQVQENGHAKCTTGDYWAIIQSYSVTCTVPPNSTYEWIEYGFGPTPINVLLVKGSVISEVQYQYMVYNKDALDIVAYDRTLQLLALPHAEIDHVLWYLNDMFIGMGMVVTVPTYIRGGKYTARAEVYSNFKKVVLIKDVEISNNTVNRIQLSCQPIHPHIDPETTNRLVTIYNGTPQVQFKYLRSSLNIGLSRYLYLEKYTYVGNARDLYW